MPNYSKHHPSPRYMELLEVYRRLHQEGERRLGVPAGRTFSGKSLLPHIRALKDLFRELEVANVLDYGAGKGQPYQRRIVDPEGEREYANVAAYWGLPVRCYDPAYPPHAARPEGRYDAVVCTDVLEHCPEEDMEWILADLFTYARRLVYANIACFPAIKRLPNGDNAHITIRPVRWWQRRIERAARHSPATAYVFLLSTMGTGGKKDIGNKWLCRGAAKPVFTADCARFSKPKAWWKRVLPRR